MSSEVLDLLSGYFSEEMIGERPDMRTSLYNGDQEGVDRVRNEFRDLLRSRSMNRYEFYRATMTLFDDDETMYGELEGVYRFFFEDEPPAPAN
jgi:hypothetical protein